MHHRPLEWFAFMGTVVEEERSHFLPMTNFVIETDTYNKRQINRREASEFILHKFLPDTGAF